MIFNCIVFQVVIEEPKACIPSCTRPPPTREEMEDWITVSKVGDIILTHTDSSVAPPKYDQLLGSYRIKYLTISEVL